MTHRLRHQTSGRRLGIIVRSTSPTARSSPYFSLSPLPWLPTRGPSPTRRPARLPSPRAILSGADGRPPRPTRTDVRADGGIHRGGHGGERASPRHPRKPQMLAILRLGRRAREPSEPAAGLERRGGLREEGGRRDGRLGAVAGRHVVV